MYQVTIEVEDGAGIAIGKYSRVYSLKESATVMLREVMTVIDYNTSRPNGEIVYHVRVAKVDPSK